jgi:hypothetical protein
MHDLRHALLLTNPSTSLLLCLLQLLLQQWQLRWPVKTPTSAHALPAHALPAHALLNYLYSVICQPASC